MDSDGYIYIADWGNQRIQIFDSNGNFVQSNRGQGTISKWAQDFLDANVEESQVRANANLEPDIEFNTDDLHLSLIHISEPTRPY